ncbi:multi-sensor hybrid histidine kinase [Cyanobacterium stanieri PCC 7202]|uniref:Circadian input-output histidine kinase CikA n=1 Tax=Cyanobacterium stanieri (strain ATCC 29140 / PCC 7202) TaxID=292563 RepID=K9YHP6_CYASC|nr:multi-sensor hybrid histidine kinase [Cyanobacterium stanieri PCC 7202]
MLNYTPLTIEQLQKGIIRHPLTVSPQATVQDAIALMSGIRSSCETPYHQDNNKKSLEIEARSSCVIVVDGEKVIGILTERDIVRLTINNQSLSNIIIGEVMVSPVITFPENQFTDIFSVINLLYQHNIRHLPILDDQEHLIGLITHESLRQLSRPIDLLKLRQVKEVMIPEVICDDEKASLINIARKMNHHQVSCIVITREKKIEAQIKQLPIGIVSERDLVQFQALNLDFNNYKAKDVMSSPPITVGLDESLLTVQHLMEKHLIRRLLVIGEQQEIRGIVTQTNILKALNPIEIYGMATMLEKRVKQLEQEKYALLQNRNRELEKTVTQRTKELQNRIKREQLIADISDHIRESLQLDNILNTCVEELRTFSKCDRVLVYQFNQDWSGVIVAESVGKGLLQSIGNIVQDSCFQESLAHNRIFTTTEVIAINNIYNHGYPDCYIQLVEKYHIKANLIVPIRIQGKLWGLLIGHQCQDFRQWQEEDTSLFKEIASALAIAIKQSINYHNLENELKERKKAEELLKESENRFRQLAENIDQVFYLIDREEEQMLYVSPNYELIWGKSCQSLYDDPQSYLNIIHPEDRHLLIQAKELREQGFQTTSEFRIIRPDGEIRWILNRTFPIKNSINNIHERTCGIAEDITEGKLNEIELTKSQQQIETTSFRLKEAQRIAKLGHWEYNHLQNTLYWSKQCYSIFGISSSEFTPSYEGFLQLIHHEDRTLVNHYYNDHLENQTDYNICHRIIRTDGQIKYVQEQCETEYDEDGTPLISRGTVQDITKLKEAELKLAQLNQELETKVAERTQELWNINHLQAMILDGTDYAIISIDCNGYIKTFNQGAENMLGYKADEVINQVSPLQFVDQQEAENHITKISQELGQETPFDINAFTIKSRLDMVNEFTITHIHKDGTRFPVQMRINPLKNEQGEIVGFLGIGKDITKEEQARSDRKRHEIERQQLLQELSAFKLGLDESAIVAITDSEGIISYVNGKFVNVSGYSENELIGKTHKIVNSGYHPRSFFKNLWDTLKKGEIWRGEICNRSKLGSLYWVESTIVPFLDREGNPFQYLAIRFDITARKLGEIRIRKENTFRQQILEQMGDGLSISYAVSEHPFIRFTVWNPKMEIITGYTLEEINNHGWYRILCPHSENQTEAIQRIKTMGQGSNLIGMVEEWEIITKTGDKRTITISTSVLAQEDNHNFVLAVIQDITDRKAKEKENILLKEQLEFVLSSSPAIIYNCEVNPPNYHPKFLSPNVQSILKHDHQKFLSGSLAWHEFIHPDDVSMVFPEMEKQLFTNDHYRCEYRFLTGDNEYVWLQDEMILLRDEYGNPLEIVGYTSNINERKQAQIELKNKTEELDQFFSLAIDLLCIANTDGYFIRLNKEWEKLLGYPLKQLEGSLFLDYIHPDDLSLTLEAIKEIQQGLEIASFTNRYRCADGSYRWLEWRCAPKQNYIYAAARDITDRKKNEEDINRHLAAIEAAMNGIAILQGDNFLYANKAHHEMFGYQQGELIGKNWRILYHPKKIKLIEQDIFPVLMTDGAWYGEIEAKKKDGSIFDEGLSLTVTDNNLLICICQDVTLRKQYEAEKLTLIDTIQRNNQLLSIISKAESKFITAENRLTIFEQLLSDLLELTNSEYGFIGEVLFREDGSAFMEENFIKIKGVPYLQTHSITNIAWNEETQKFYDENYQAGMQFTNMNTLFGAVIMTGKPVIANSPSTDPRRGGIPSEHPPLNAFLGLPFFSDNKLIGIVGIANAPGGYDNSVVEYLQPFLMTCSILIEGYRLDAGQKLAEKELFKSNQQLMKANRLKDEFLANMSHELRTPLNAILGMTEGLSEQIFGEINNKQLKALETIERSGTHLLELINDILDLAKIEAGQLELQLSNVSLDSLSESSLTFIKQLAFKKRIKLNTEIPTNVPCLMIDERKIRQVLINLLNNAVKFTPEGGNISIKISNATPGEIPNFVTKVFKNSENTSLNNVYISVVDTGIGIPPNKFNSLFEPFVQVDSALNRQYSGTGLGLSLVKRIVELHGGFVILSSRVGFGSSFTIALPYNSSACEISQSWNNDNPQIISSNSIQPSSNALILLAEDNEANISTISSYLKAKGYRVIIAKNGEEAVSFSQTEKPDLILMDIQMPKMSGFDAIVQIRQNSETTNIPIIALTALAMKDDQNKCLEIGVNDYFSKPLKLRALTNKIQELLS